MGIIASLQQARGLPLTQVNGLAADPFVVFMFKLLPLICELLTIIMVAWWCRHQRIMRWLLPLLMAIAPGMIVNSAWWGQSDSIMLLLLVLSLMALNKDRPVWAWALLAVALLTKFQSIVLVPVLVTACWRRYGWRRTLTGTVICGLIVGTGLLPFVLVSGWSAALEPFIGVVGQLPGVTFSALNYWALFAPKVPGFLLPPNELVLPDNIAVLGPLTLRHLGLVTLALYTLLTMLTIWRQNEQRREFIWATAVYTAFFSLPTEIHERYFYPAALFLIIGIAQDRRALLAAVTVMFTFGYNLLVTITEPTLFWLPWLAAYEAALLIAVLNILVFVEVTYLLMTTPTISPQSRSRRFAPVRLILYPVRFIGLLVLCVALFIMLR
jgi:Gpi18-like mannosyltransferase